MRTLRALGLVLAAMLLAGCITTNEDGAVVQEQGPDMAEASRLNTQLGIDHLRRGRIDLALEKLTRATEQDPRNADAQLGLALVQDRRNDHEAASKHYRRALSLKPNDPLIQNNFGIFLCRDGDRKEAERLFLAAAGNVDYRTPEAALTNAGVCAMQHQDYTAAEAYFRDALQRNRNFPDALLQMTRLSMQLERYVQARAFLQRYEQVGKPTPTSLLMGARTETALGDTAAASRYAERLRTQFPDATEASQL